MAKFSDFRSLVNFYKSLDSQPCWREVYANVIDEVEDFEVDGVRFITESSIDSIQQDELSGDLYVLGCFNSWFLADILSIDEEVIQAMKEAEAFEALGKLIVLMGKLEELQGAYASADGYGHHFNKYDNGEDEYTFNGTMYHVFDNRNY